MRKLLLRCVIILAVPCLVFAQGGNITLSSDTEGTDCNIFDVQPGVIRVHVLHTLATTMVSGSAFSVPIPGCAVGMTWVGDVGVFPVTVGFSPTGIAISYGGSCLETPFHILTIVYFGQGTSSSCCLLNVGPPNPGHCDLEQPCAVDCVSPDDRIIPANGSSAIINPDASCQCNVPVEETTWGQVKNLFNVN